MTAIPLNVFQRLIRTWDAVHPYNAAQVLTLRGNADVSKVVEAWQQALASLRLGRVRVDGRAFRHELLNGDAHCYSVRLLPPGAALDEHLTTELNRPFDEPDEPPFRAFFILGSESFQIGVVYQHWVADSVSIRRLMREWCAGVLGDASLSDPPPIAARQGYWDLFGARNARLQVDQMVLGLFRSHMRFRQVLKISPAATADYAVRVAIQSAPAGLPAALREFAHSRGARVGDVLLAALAEACAAHVPFQRRGGRSDIAVGTIVDLRPHAGQNLSERFGLYLGFTHVVCRPADLRDFDRLLRVVSLQNSIQRRNVGTASGAWMSAALAIQRLVPPEKLYHFYRKEVPLAAGLSNVNLAGTWAEQLHPDRLIDYLRVSPTGPMAPIALGVTTLGEQMQFSLTWRPSVLSLERAEIMMRRMIERLEALTNGCAARGFADQ